MKNISNFLNHNKDKKIVAVQGLGFVGSVMSLVVANSPNNNYAVIGVDLFSNRKNLEKLNNGIFPIESSDKKINSLLERSLKNKTFIATFDKEVYKYADIIIVDINLDIDKSYKSDILKYDLNLSPFKKAISDIAKVSKEDVLVIVETTVPPGTTEKIIKPIFEKEFKKRNLTKKFKLSHSY